MKLLLLLGAVTCLLHLTNSQCTLDQDQLNNNIVASLTADSIVAGNQGGTATVIVQDFNIVCLAIGTDVENFRSISVVVQYSCTGSSCPPGKLMQLIMVHLQYACHLLHESHCSVDRWCTAHFAS